jgi:hypothetical protein
MGAFEGGAERPEVNMLGWAKFLRLIPAFWRAARGNAGAEFALTLPLLAVLLFGGYEIGRALHDYHVVAETVRDAARFLGRAPILCTGAGTGCTTCNKATGECGTCDFVSATDLDDAESLAMTGKTSGGSKLLGGWTDPNSITIEMCTIDNSGGGLGGLYDNNVLGVDMFGDVVPHVRLTADVPFTFLFGEMVSPNGTINITLSHTAIAAGL